MHSQHQIEVYSQQQQQQQQQYEIHYPASLVL
jgi:hypothetical protein